MYVRRRFPTTDTEIDSKSSDVIISVISFGSASVSTGATASECEVAANQLLNFVQISGGTAVVTPNPILPSSELITVTVTVPTTAANLFVTPRFYIGRTIVSSVSLPRERQF